MKMTPQDAKLAVLEKVRLRLEIAKDDFRKTDLQYGSSNPILQGIGKLESLVSAMENQAIKNTKLSNDLFTNSFSDFEKGYRVVNNALRTFKVKTQ
jgi:hypothetical protein